MTMNLMMTSLNMLLLVFPYPLYGNIRLFTCQVAYLRHGCRTQPDTRKEMKLTPKTFFQSQSEAGPSRLAPSVDNGQEAIRYQMFVQLFDG
jgi:hypothetical protein